MLITGDGEMGGRGEREKGRKGDKVILMVCFMAWSESHFPVRNSVILRLRSGQVSCLESSSFATLNVGLKRGFQTGMTIYLVGLRLSDVVFVDSAIEFTCNLSTL